MTDTKLTAELLDELESHARHYSVWPGAQAPIRPEVLLSLIAAARELESRWVPVSERFPEGGRVVLAFDAATGQSALVWRDRDEPVWFPANGLARPLAADITHWMPLPKGSTNGR